MATAILLGQEAVGEIVEMMEGEYPECGDKRPELDRENLRRNKVTP